MLSKAQIDEFIGCLQKYELTIASLYETFAAVLPESSQVWMKYAGEERRHAEWIDVLHTHLKNEKISFEQTKITNTAIRTSIAYIESQIERVGTTGLKLRQALSIAVDIEKALLESAFLKTFKFAGPKAAAVQSRLIEATKIHVMALIDWQNDQNKHPASNQ